MEIELENDETLTPEQVDSVADIWEQLVLELFGFGAMGHIENLGRYMFLRQKRIFNIYGKMDNAIFNKESRKLYETKCFDRFDNTSGDKVFAKNPKLDGDF